MKKILLSTIALLTLLVSTAFAAAVEPSLTIYDYKTGAEPTAYTKEVGIILTLKTPADAWDINSYPELIEVGPLSAKSFKGEDISVQLENPVFSSYIFELPVTNTPGEQRIFIGRYFLKSSTGKPYINNGMILNFRIKFRNTFNQTLGVITASEEVSFNKNTCGNCGIK